MRILQLALLFAVLAAPALGSSAQQRGSRRAAPKKPAKTAKIEPIESAAFDRSQTKLPVNFFGTNPAWLYGRLEQLLRPKGEFESTSDYLNALGTRIPNIDLAFSLPGDFAYKFITYDADTKRVNLNLENGTTPVEGVYRQKSPTGGESELKGYGFLSLDTSTNRGSYTASNAFGARARVRSTVHTRYGVALQTTETRPFIHDGPSPFAAPIVSVEMSPDIARRVKPNLAVLLVGSLRTEALPHSLVVKTTRYDEPTISVPREDYTLTYWINFSLSEIWLYDTKTGEIWAKEKWNGWGKSQHSLPMKPSRSTHLSVEWDDKAIDPE